MKVPALTEWRAQLRAGKRTIDTIDPLWRAAASEAQALELQHVAPGAARQCLEDARRIVLEALRAEQKGAPA